MSSERVVIAHEADILAARRAARALGAVAGFSDLEMTLVATAISEIARNMLQYARGGTMQIELLDDGPAGRAGLSVTAADQGPGIPDIERAMTDGYTTGNGLGLGLPGARRLMDEFSVQSKAGVGTTIVMKKWRGR